ARLWAPPAAPKPVAPPAAPATAAPAAAGDMQRFMAAMRQLQQPAPSLRGALTLALDALHGGLGLRRVAAMLYRPQPPQLQTLLGRGLDDAPDLRQLQLPVAAGSLLEQLLRKPACLRLAADQNARYRALLPAPLRAALSADVLLTSLVVEGRPLALLIADDGGAAIDAGRQQRVRQLGALLGQCLAQLGNGAAPR